MTPTNAELPQRRANADLLLDKARSGSRKALGKVLEVYRPYLLKIADAIESQLLRPKVEPDDLVQETLLEAVASFPTFRGSTEPEFRMWLRRILLRRLAALAQRFLCGRRDVRREQPLAKVGSLSEATARPRNGDPPADAEGREDELSTVLEWMFNHLSDDHCLVIVYCVLGQRPIPEVARVMRRTPEAVRKLCFRAVTKAHRLYEAQSPLESGMVAPQGGSLAYRAKQRGQES